MTEHTAHCHLFSEFQSASLHNCTHFHPQFRPIHQVLTLCKTFFSLSVFLFIHLFLFITVFLFIYQLIIQSVSQSINESINLFSSLFIYPYTNMYLLLLLVCQQHNIHTYYEPWLCQRAHASLIKTL